ncbi:hypothetical protein GCM10020258_11570 [Sphingomonas yabuuchiae]
MGECGGRGFRLDAASGLASSEWLAVGETQGAASGARILSAAPLDLATVEALFADRIETRRTVTFNPATGGVEALRERRLGGLRLSSGPDRARHPTPSPRRWSRVRTHGLSLLPWSDGAGLTGRGRPMPGWRWTTRRCSNGWTTGCPLWSRASGGWMRWHRAR